ncbi:MAG: hypothetical protein E7358_04145 [Clostridiales bacterium]|nr:hypothetical protein [Clostridiales bacterium]
MSQIKITESAKKSNNIIYIYEMLSLIIKQLGCIEELRGGKNRYELILDVPSSYKDLLLFEIEDKIADVISVNYKYTFFKKHVNLSGLNGLEKELLLTALIAADIDEDKKYVIKKLKNFQEYALDGIFNFRMKALKEKWNDILGYIPPGFQSLELKDFIIYLIKDKMGKRVYFDEGSVYDKSFNVLKRVELLSGDSGEISIVKEILLSGAGEVELGTKLPKNDEFYLKQLYGDRVRFSSSYFSQNS